MYPNSLEWGPRQTGCLCVCNVNCPSVPGETLALFFRGTTALPDDLPSVPRVPRVPSAGSTLPACRVFPARFPFIYRSPNIFARADGVCRPCLFVTIR
jgi:hypothetical protein